MIWVFGGQTITEYLIRDSYKANYFISWLYSIALNKPTWQHPQGQTQEIQYTLLMILSTNKTALAID